MNDPIVFEEKGCPVCRGDLMAEESLEGGFLDGEPFFCANSACGYHGCICVNDGIASPAPSDDIESLVHVIEEQRVRLLRARDHLLRIWPRGKDCEHQDARQAFMALEDA